MKSFDVFLYRAPECIRGWLSYLTSQGQPDVLVRVKAESGAKAKNAAITAANRGFEGVEIIEQKAASAKVSTETRWPNVQAAIMENGCWLECEAEGAWVLAILNGSEIRRYSKGKPTLELALDSLEQKLAERKEGK